MSRFRKLVPTLFMIFLLIVVTSFFYDVNQVRSVALIVIFSLWLLIAGYSRNALFASLALLILAFPLNISFQIHSFIERAYVNGVLINYLVPTVYLVDLLVSLLFLSILFSQNKIKKLSKNLKVLIFLVAFYFGVHNFISQDINVFFTSSRYVLYILTVILTYTYRTRFVFLLKKYSLALYISVLFALVTQVLFAYLQYKTGSNLGLYALGESVVSVANVGVSSVSLGGDLHLRGYGTFSHPNVLAGYLSFILLLLGIKWLQKSSLLMIEYLIGTLAIVGIFLTFSQSAILFVFILAIIIVLRVVSLKLKSKEKSKSFLPISLISLKSILIPDGRSIQERIDLLNSSVEYLKEYYLTGVGVGNFVKYFYPYAPIGVAGITLTQPVHNIYMLFILENGILFGGVILLAYILWVGFRLYVSNKRTALLLVLLYLVVFGNLDHYLLTIPQGFLLFMLTFILFTLDEWIFLE